VSAGPPADTMRSVSKAVRAITNPIFLPENLRMDKADSARIRIDCLALFARFRFHTVGLAAAGACLLPRQRTAPRESSAKK
jgi:hypothetical protein